MHQRRSIRFIGREDFGEWRLKVYGIGTHAPDAPPEFVAATLRAARSTSGGWRRRGRHAHDANAAGLSLVYWWANENEIHGRFFVSPLEDPTELVLHDGTGLICVWELEIIDFERRAWLEDVLKNDDLEAYLGVAAPDAEI